MFSNEHMSFADQPMHELEKCRTAIIKQQSEAKDASKCGESPNRYHVYTVDPEGHKTYLFKCASRGDEICDHHGAQLHGILSYFEAPLARGLVYGR